MEKKYDLMEGVGRVWLLLKRFGRKRISELDIGLTFDQMLVLFTLDKHEGLKIGDVAEMTDRDRTTTSRMITGLEKKNLVLRVPDREDNRQKLIYLTRSARDIMDGLEPLRKEFEISVFKGLSPEELKKTGEILNRVADNLERD
jgi:DNA-binding MarR family transcriptional regulator